MSEIHFAQPQWIHALWGVLVFVLLSFWLDRRGGGALDLLLGPALRPRLVKGLNPFRRQLRLWLLGLSAVCLVVALMRPQFGIRHVAAPRIGAEIMVALDVSQSMLAEDVAPNRLERAKAEIVDLLSYLDGDQVGLIAFAGRATVLAPLTPDFSFLRLVLDGAGPHSVSRGGTRLEEPIRKAVEGFGPAADASRAILLITDGEDHDSFPLDAAEAAAEQGIAIIAIGFGDELGSEIYRTDPRSGARELVRDAEGRPVRSRLDGELLRELALKTGGAYVPAGTGVLDLESIYRQHIEPLMIGQLDPRGRTVRDEGYQWAVLLGLILLVSSVAVSGGSVGMRATALLLAAIHGAPPGARAEEADPASPLAALEQPIEVVVAESDETVAEPDESAAEPDEAADPRELFNRGVSALDEDDLDAAQRWLDRARREAAGDGELRFRAAYNLGISFAARAETLEADAPAEALQANYVAADWFRDAISQRPEDEDSRVNLDVVLHRALVLADRIAQQSQQGVDAELEQIAARQRELVAEVAALLERTAGEPEGADGELVRRQFRARATDQRALLSDGDRLAREIDAEREAIAARSEEEAAPEDQLRGAQLDGVLHYLHRAREKMGQARRQLRQRQSERAYRRSSAALAELKRALDQLRDPVETLDELIREVRQVGSSTALLAFSGGELPGAAEPVAVPGWLNRESLLKDQRGVAARTEELDQKLVAGLGQGAGDDPQAQALFQAIREAEPLVAGAAAQLSEAASEIESGALQAALPSQRDGLRGLTDARERFLDLRGLIEAAYADERRIEQLLVADGEEAGAARVEYLPALRELQERNLARGERLGAQLEEAAQSGPAEPDADPQSAAIQQQRFELAGQLVTLALARMDDVERAFGAENAPAERVDWQAALGAGRAAVGHLESLRRLFFSITEQLKDAIRQQVDLADATQDAAALADPASPAATLVEELAPRQDLLAVHTGEIANALAEQANQAGGVVEEESDSWETSRRLRLAGEHTLVAQTEMEGAAEWLGGDPPQLLETPQRQAAAIAELEAALEQLVPPEEREQPNDPSEPEPSPSEGDESGQADGEQEESESAPVDPAQLLQAVRDREAQRRRDAGQRGPAGYDTVEKDW